MLLAVYAYITHGYKITDSTVFISDYVDNIYAFIRQMTAKWNITNNDK